MSIRNWPIIWKVVSLLLLLGSVSLGGAVISAQRLTSIDATYQNLLGHSVQGAIVFTRAARYITQYELALRQAIMSQTPDQKTAAVKAQQAALATFDKNLETAKTLLPNSKDGLQEVANRLHAAAEGGCSVAIKALDSGVAQATEAMERQCEPALAGVLQVGVALNTEIGKTMSDESVIASTSAAAVSRNMLIIMVASLVAIVALAVLVVRSSVVVPIHQSMSRVEALGRGELADPVLGTNRKDEIGAIAKALETLRGQLRDAEELRQRQASRDIAERDILTRREKLASQFVARMRELAASFSGSSDEVATAARNLSTAAEETSQQAQTVAAAAEEAAANVQTVASSAEQMAASVREINSQVTHSAEVADSAFKEAETSSTRISALATAANAIGDVVNLIKGIADQTNLLALNATIEAARAGEAGKGFAVVASEVKQLASQTGRATEDISRKVEEIQMATGESVESMTEIVKVIGSMKEIASSISGAVTQQDAATGEIARNCQQAAVGTQQVTQNISGVGQAAEMTGTASVQLTALSSSLYDKAEDLRSVVETFVKDFAA